MIRDGRLHGLGSADMKGTVAAEAMAMILLRRAGVPLRRTLTFLCAADEEAGGAWGAGWVAAERCTGFMFSGSSTHKRHRPHISRASPMEGARHSSNATMTKDRFEFAAVLSQNSGILSRRGK